MVAKSMTTIPSKGSLDIASPNYYFKGVEDSRVLGFKDLNFDTFYSNP